MKEYYWPETLRQVQIAFADFFDDIYIKKYDKAGVELDTIKVPLKFGPRDKYYDIRKESEFGKKYYMKYPNMAFILTDISYASERAESVNTYRHFYNESAGLSTLSEYFKDVSPVPYDYSFALSIRAENMKNFSQIIEQILPHFSPDTTLRVKEFSFLNIERDLPLVMNGNVGLDFIVQQEEDNRREVNGSINFTVKGYSYKGPIESSKIIKIIESEYFIDSISTSATPTSATSVSVNEYDTSGYWKTSAGILSGTPDTYDFSAYSPDNSAYAFISATNYNE